MTDGVLKTIYNNLSIQSNKFYIYNKDVLFYNKNI